MPWICHGIADSISSFYCLHRFWFPAIVPLSSHTVTRERFIAILAVLTVLVYFLDPIGVIMLFTSTLSRLEPLRWVKFSPRTVAPCTLRHRFGLSSVWPSLLLWVRPTSDNASLWLSRKVISRLPLSLQLYSLTQKHVGFEFSIREDVIRPPSVTQESIRNHLDCDHPSNHYLLKLPFVHGMSHHTKATYSSLSFQAVVTDIRELRTILRSTALPVLFTWEQTHMEGF